MGWRRYHAEQLSRLTALLLRPRTAVILALVALLPVPATALLLLAYKPDKPNLSDVEHQFSQPEGDSAANITLTLTGLDPEGVEVPARITIAQGDEPPIGYKRVLTIRIDDHVARAVRRIPVGQEALEGGAPAVRDTRGHCPRH
jgi:hypothetical protein